MPYAIVGGILALLVFLIICVLVGMVWCSVRQKGEWGWGLNPARGVVWGFGRGRGPEPGLEIRQACSQEIRGWG